MSFKTVFWALAVALGLAPTLAAATPGLNERIVADPSSGIALYGFDPVAYFTEGRAVLGRRDVETEWNGSAWRFASEANRAAFLSAPEVYAPRFGGYDPLAVASGVAVPGHPLLFTVKGERLYLFRTATERDAFHGAESADRAWPLVAAGLTD